MKQMSFNEIIAINTLLNFREIINHSTLQETTNLEIQVEPNEHHSDYIKNENNIVEICQITKNNKKNKKQKRKHVIKELLESSILQNKSKFTKVCMKKLKNNMDKILNKRNVNACFEHRRKHQRCDLTCPFRAENLCQ